MQTLRVRLGPVQGQRPRLAPSWRKRELSFLQYTSWFDKRPQACIWTLGRLEQELQRPRVVRCANTKQEIDNAKGRRELFCFVRLGRGGKPKALTAFPIDFDDGTPQHKLRRVRCLHALRLFDHPTHARDAPLPRHPTARLRTRSIRFDALYEWVQGLGLRPDLNCRQVKHKFLLPMMREGGKYRWWVNEAPLFDWKPSSQAEEPLPVQTLDDRYHDAIARLKKQRVLGTPCFDPWNNPETLRLRPRRVRADGVCRGSR